MYVDKRRTVEPDLAAVPDAPTDLDLGVQLPDDN